MKRIIILLTCVQLLSTVNLFAQRFSEPVTLDKSTANFEPNGEYLFVGDLNGDLHKWNIKEGKLEASWDSLFVMEMYFTDAGIYFIQDFHHMAERQQLWKLNGEDVELYYTVPETTPEGNYSRIQGVGKDGEVLVYTHKKISISPNYTAGKLFVVRPNTQEESLITPWAYTGSVLMYRPGVQQVFDSKVVYADATKGAGKNDFTKTPLMLYDVKTGKQTRVEKNIDFNNFVLHGLKNTFISEIHYKPGDASQFTIYNAEGKEINSFDWKVYNAFRYDYVNDEVYFLRQDKEIIDVYSPSENRVVKTLKAFDDFSTTDRYNQKFSQSALPNGQQFKLVIDYYSNNFIGHVEQFNFETGEYEKVGQPMKEGLTFESKEAMKTDLEAAAKINNEEARLKNFRANVEDLPVLPASGKMQSFISFGAAASGKGFGYTAGNVASYNELPESVAMVAACETEDSILMLVRSSDYEQKIQGDYIIARDITNYYLSVITGNALHKEVLKVGDDVFVTKTNKNNVNDKKSGLLQVAIDFSWGTSGDIFTLRNNRNQTFSFNIKSCKKL